MDLYSEPREEAKRKPGRPLIIHHSFKDLRDKRIAAKERDRIEKKMKKKAEQAGYTGPARAKALMDAIAKVEKKYSCNYWERVVERSMAEPSLAIAILKKLVPDLTETAMDVVNEIKIDFSDSRTASKKEDNLGCQT